MAIPDPPSNPPAAGPPTLDLLRRHRDDILRVAADHAASNVRVFGSVARGEARPDSDVDLVVDLAATIRGFAFFAALHRLEAALERLLGRPVDVVSVHASGPRAEAILRDAVAL
jgi:predicted nucleotidyltransferase